MKFIDPSEPAAAADPPFRSVTVVSPDPASTLTEIRLRTPLEAWASRRGAEVSFKTWPQFPSDLIRNTDLFVFHREMPTGARDLFALAHRSNRRIIYEIDDLLTELPSHLGGERAMTESLDAIAQVLKGADGVSTSTPRLAKTLEPLMSPDMPCVVAPNYATEVPPHDWPQRKPRPTGRPVRELVIASSDDIRCEMLLPALRAVNEQRPDVQLLVVGPPGARLEAAGLRLRRFDRMSVSDFRRWLCSLEAPAGVIPLEDNRFSACKSAVKYFLYATCRLPALVSKVPPYADVVEHGRNGLLVANDGDSWFQALSRVLADPTGLAAIVERAEQDVLQRHHLDANVAAWDALMRHVAANPIRKDPWSSGLAGGILGARIRFQGWHDKLRDLERRHRHARRARKAAAEANGTDSAKQDRHS